MVFSRMMRITRPCVDRFRWLVVRQEVEKLDLIHNKKSSTNNFAVMEYDPSLTLIDGGPI